MGHRGDQRSADPVHAQRGHRRSGPLRACRTCRRASTRCGCAAMASSIRRRSIPSPASSSISPPCRRPTTPRRRSTIRRSTGIRCSRFRAPTSSAARATFRPMSRPADWLNLMKNNGCVGCHQLGQAATRTIPKAFGDFKTGEDAWIRRTQSGQAGELMVNILAGQLGGAPYKYFGDWTDRIAKGELPFAKPNAARPASSATSSSPPGTGPTRSTISTISSSSDKRNPTVNGYGPVFGQPEYSTDRIPILEPGDQQRRNLQGAGARREHADVARTRPRRHAQAAAALRLLGRRADLGHQDQQPQLHDRREGPDVARRRGARRRRTPPSARRAPIIPRPRLFPLAESHRQLAMLDPKTMKYTFVDTCFTTHHLNFAKDANDTLWASSGGGTGAVGWFNTKLFDETGDAVKAQGWTPLILDTNGNGKRDDYVEPNQPVDPDQGQADRPGVLRGDGEPGRRLGVGDAAREPRLDRADRSGPRSGQRPRSPKSTTSRCRASARAAAISTARAWCGCRSRAAISAASTGASARARSTARPRPATTAPRAGRSTSIRVRASRASARTARKSSYYSWVDQHNTFGLGEDVPVSTGEPQ